MTKQSYFIRSTYFFSKRRQKNKLTNSPFPSGVYDVDDAIQNKERPGLVERSMVVMDTYDTGLLILNRQFYITDDKWQENL